MKDEEWERIKKEASRIVKRSRPKSEMGEALARNMRLGNIFDLVFLCFSLFPEETKETMLRIGSREFYEILRELWSGWSFASREELGSFIESGDGQKRYIEDQISYGFCAQSGPGDGYISSAERYFWYYPAIGRCRTLLEYFINPSETSRSWDKYRFDRYGADFAVWQKDNRKYFWLVMDFVRIVCEKMEVEAAHREAK
jgi:hypothetical protein